MLFKPLFELRTNPGLDLNRLKFERLSDSRDELYNVVSSAAISKYVWLVFYLLL